MSILINRLDTEETFFFFCKLSFPVSSPVVEQWQRSIPKGPHKFGLDALPKSLAATCTYMWHDIPPSRKPSPPHHTPDQREPLMVRNELALILHAKTELQRLLK